MRIATWNINGIKARLGLLLTWLKQEEPDIVVLQEIKSIDENFPRSDIEALGYNIETHGQKSWNGVAILSKRPFDEVTRGLPGDDSDEQARLIEAVFSVETGAIRVCGIYLPNGNPVESEKFPYKLRWMDRLIDYVEERLRYEEPFILLGDFNIIPAPEDARNPENWWGDALYRPESLEKFRILRNMGMTDALRSISAEEAYRGQTIGRAILGTPETVQSFTPDQIRAVLAKVEKESELLKLNDLNFPFGQGLPLDYRIAGCL